jgi:hypothetical protein
MLDSLALPPNGAAQPIDAGEERRANSWKDLSQSQRVKTIAVLEQLHKDLSIFKAESERSRLLPCSSNCTKNCISRGTFFACAHSCCCRMATTLPYCVVCGVQEYSVPPPFEWFECYLEEHELQGYSKNFDKPRTLSSTPWTLASKLPIDGDCCICLERKILHKQRQCTHRLCHECFLHLYLHGSGVCPLCRSPNPEDKDPNNIFEKAMIKFYDAAEEYHPGYYVRLMNLPSMGWQSLAAVRALSFLAHINGQSTAGVRLHPVNSDMEKAVFDAGKWNHAQHASTHHLRRGQATQSQWDQVFSDDAAAWVLWGQTGEDVCNPVGRMRTIIRELANALRTCHRAYFFDEELGRVHNTFDPQFIVPAACRHGPWAIVR